MNSGSGRGNLGALDKGTHETTTQVKPSKSDTPNRIHSPTSLSTLNPSLTSGNFQSLGRPFVPPNEL